MFDIQNYGSFIAAIIVLQLIPGPGTFAILNAKERNRIVQHVRRNMARPYCVDWVIG